MPLHVFRDFLKPWVAFSVVDEEGVGRVDALDVKVSPVPNVFKRHAWQGLHSNRRRESEAQAVSSCLLKP